MTRSSNTHPLRVDFVELPSPGRLGMTFAPGKVQPHAASGSWERDLDQDLTRLRDIYNTKLLVSVIELHELEQLHIPQLPARLQRYGIDWLHLDVVDGSTPKDDAPWLAAMRQIKARLGAGDNVVVHCKGGLGRTGTLVASVLTTYGLSPVEAIAKTRVARPNTLETKEQVAYVARVAGR